jgi:TP901 family phage tail tape measure protein
MANKQIGQFVAEFIANTEGLSQGFNKATGLSDKFSGSIAAGMLKAQAIVGALEVGFKAVMGAVAAATTKTADYGDMINDASQRTGLAASELSKLKFAADQSGSSFEQVSSAVGKMAKNMDGNSDAFGRLGISVKDVQGQLRPTSDVLGDVADKFAHMEDGAQKSAIAQDIFGKSGADLIPLLNEGRDGLKDMGDAAERYGLVIGDEAAAAGDAFNDSLASLEGATAGLAMTIGEALLPSLTVMIEATAEVVVVVGDWVRANKPLIASLVDLGRNIVVVLVDFVARAIESISDLLDLAGKVAAAMGMGGMAGKIMAVSDAGHKMALSLKTANDKMADSFYATEKADGATKKYTTTIGSHESAVKKAADAHDKLESAIIKAQTVSAKFAASAVADMTKSADAMEALALKTANDIAAGQNAAMISAIDQLDKFDALWDKERMKFIGDSNDTADQATAAAVRGSVQQGKAILDGLDATGKANKDAADSYQRIWETAAGNMAAGIGKAFTDVLFHGGNFRDSMVGLFKQTGESMFQSIVTGFITPFTSALSQIGSNLAKIAMDAIGIGSGPAGGILGGVTGPGGILGGIFGGGGAAGGGAAAGGAGGGLGGAVGGLMTNPWTIAIGAGIAGVTAWLKSQAHHEANTLVKNIENPFWQAWGQILPTDNAADLAAMDPTRAAEIGGNLAAMNANYLSLINEFRIGGADEEKVSVQSLANTQPHYERLIAALRSAVVSGGSIPKFRSGIDWVPRDMLAVIHQGERVVKAGENKGGRYGNVTIHITQAPGQNARELAMAIKSILTTNTGGLRDAVAAV